MSDKDCYRGEVAKNFQDVVGLDTSYSLSNVLLYIPSC